MENGQNSRHVVEGDVVEGDNHTIFKKVVDQGSLIRKYVGFCPYESHYKLSHDVFHWLLNSRDAQRQIVCLMALTVLALGDRAPLDR